MNAERSQEWVNIQQGVGVSGKTDMQKEPSQHSNRFSAYY